MFKNLFSNRLFIAALAFFVLCVGGSLLYQQHVYKETDQKLAETEEFQRWWKAGHATPPSDATETPKSEAGEPVEVGASPVKVPSVDEAENENFPDFASLSPEEQQQIFAQFYLQHGLKPPPKGYRYIWKDIGVPLLDENGNPVLHEEDVAWVEIKMGIGFAPTLEEYERYEQLREDYEWADTRGEVAKAKRLAAEIEALEASVQRMRPLSTMSSWAGPTGTEDKAKSDRLRDEKFNAALREYDLEHLISPY